MSPSLFPLIRQFAGRPGPLVWRMSQVGRPHLRAAQVANRLHHDLADAVLVVTLAARR